MPDKTPDGIDFYKHDPSNGGVASAYNYAIALAAEKEKNWLILFDQDTTISNDFFQQLESSSLHYPNVKLFCPLVMSNNSIVSPTFLLLEKPLKPKKLSSGILKSRYFTIINSGLAIQVKALQDLGGYDTDLPLDLSDHNFFRKFKKRNKDFVLINAKNLHNLSSENDDHFPIVFARFKNYYRSAHVYSEKIKSVFPLFWLWVRTVRLTIKFNRFDFIKFILYKK